MRTDEEGGFAPFILHEGSFAELGVLADFAIEGDAGHGVAGMGIEDVVVATPEFEAEVGTEGNEAVELEVVASGPGEAAEDGDGEG